MEYKGGVKDAMPLPSLHNVNGHFYRALPDILLEKYVLVVPGVIWMTPRIIYELSKMKLFSFSSIKVE